MRLLVVAVLSFFSDEILRNETTTASLSHDCIASFHNRLSYSFRYFIYSLCCLLGSVDPFVRFRKSYYFLAHTSENRRGYCATMNPSDVRSEPIRTYSEFLTFPLVCARTSGGSNSCNPKPLEIIAHLNANILQKERGVFGYWGLDNLDETYPS